MFHWFRKLTSANLLKFGLGLFLFLLPWPTIWIYQERYLNGAKWEQGTLGFYGTEILLWLSIGLFIVWYWKNFKLQAANNKFKLTRDRVFVFSIFLFVLYLFLSIFWAIDAAVALQQALHVTEAFLLFFMLYLGPLRFAPAAVWFIAGATIQSILGIWQFLAQSTFALKWLGLVSHPVWEAGTSVVSSPEIGRWLRAYGSFSHPNVFGGYLAISILVTSVLLLRVKSQGIKYRLLIAASFILQVAALFFTFSRSAWIAAAVAAVFHAYLIKSRSSYSHSGLSLILTAFVLSIIGLTLFFPLAQTRFARNSISEWRSTEERILGYEEALELFKKKPWFGAGVGNYTAALHQLHPSQPGWEYQPVHNVFFLVAVETGMAGVILLAIIFWAFCALHSIFFSLDAKAVLLFILFFLSLLFFDHYLFSSYVGLLFTAVFLSIFLRIHPRLLHR